MWVTQKRQNGFSLLEVMVSAVIAVIALLGLAAAQLKALQFATSSFQYTVATIQANNAGEILWPDLCDAIDEDKYDDVLTKLKNSSVQGYTLTALDEFDTDFEITVEWVDERLDSSIAPSVSIYPQYPTLVAGDC
ncbi:prepilin-type N-terminal cleavage/methylation domain-containing protein [Alteromonas sp. 5E99-2]|uniref:type IV pilus modification PilV family protein n=1 Tax=Alteromonas sp. 5E99-2 TaxID=2817683 RepID=UPI001A9900F7|nr:prepilin-type N-terminal cleavage/methylation domain-containing protein [Alteromonas sp. 5E99-2]MBO1255806.1 prepilin-type N-terminal cleavage/methylation domain-containing protein [Alteromonas sp. 5E99-2]